MLAPIVVASMMPATMPTIVAPSTAMATIVASPTTTMFSMVTTAMPAMVAITGPAMVPTAISSVVTALHGLIPVTMVTLLRETRAMQCALIIGASVPRAA
ncbi:hypothetical protein GGH91_001892 [Coemansia sp. RSA 2671]|nr:hypothetical protein GGH91_001892 [Coemansia sp. RSA 2671]